MPARGGELCAASSSGGQLRLGGLGLQAVADPIVGVDVLPARGAQLELAAQFVDADVDRPTVPSHLATPQGLVDALALEHLAAREREQLDQVVLAQGEPEAAP